MSLQMGLAPAHLLLAHAQMASLLHDLMCFTTCYLHLRIYSVGLGLGEAYQPLVGSAPSKSTLLTVALPAMSHGRVAGDSVAVVSSL